MGHHNRSHKRAREESQNSDAETSIKGSLKKRIGLKDDSCKISPGRSRFTLNYALYLYLRDCGYKKTARALEKDTETVYNKSKAEKPNFSLAPLFTRILTELDKEESKDSSKDGSTTAEEKEIDSQGYNKNSGYSAVETDYNSSGYNLAETDSFGNKAATDLGKVQGKGFRKEKNKKKKSTWKGNGSISFQTQSERLDLSDAAEFFVHLSADVGSVLVNNLLGLDLGGTLAKVVYVLDETIKPPAKILNDTIPPILRFNHNKRVYRCYFIYFQTSQIEDLILFLTENNLIPRTDPTWRLRVTGGGAFKFQDMLSEKLNVNILKCDEMKSVMTGLKFVIAGKNASFSYDLTKDRRVPKEYVDNAYPFLLVNIGSGVSILKAQNSQSFVRVSGTCIGGGTALGLCQLCFGAKSFEEVVRLSEKGSDSLDMRISDVIGDTAGSRTLPSDTLASSFGRLYTDSSTKDNLKKEDIARSAIRMISYNLGYLGLLLAKIHNTKRGKYISDHDFTMKTITQAVTFYHIYDQNTSKSNAGDCFSTSDSEFKEEDKDITFDEYVGELQKVQKEGKAYEALFLRHDGYLGAIGALLHIDEESTTPLHKNDVSQ